MERLGHASSIALRVNGVRRELVVDHRATVLDALREQLDVISVKKGCDHGQCGACTVLVDGRRMNSCLLLAVAHEDAEVITAEGLTEGDRPHPVQRAFLERDAFQCGYCTPGQVCSAVGVLRELADGWPSHVTSPDVPPEEPAPVTDDEIRERMSGNLCRCGAYVNIVRAVDDAVPRDGEPIVTGGQRGEVAL